VIPVIIYYEIILHIIFWQAYTSICYNTMLNITLGSSIHYASDESYNPYIETILSGMYLNIN